MPISSKQHPIVARIDRLLIAARGSLHMSSNFPPLLIKIICIILINITLVACNAPDKETENTKISIENTENSNTIVGSKSTSTKAYNLTEGNAEASYSTSSPIPLYRLYNQVSGEHLYTQKQGEYLTLGTIGWIQENISFYAFDHSAIIDSVEATPWFRVYNPNSGLHHWTIDQNEYDTLGQLGWAQEGASGFIFATEVAGSVPLYRLYNPNDGTHHWTMDTNERAALISAGWNAEGVAGYVFNSIAQFKGVLTLGGKPISGVEFISGTNTGLTSQSGTFNQDGTSNVTFKVAGLIIGTVTNAELPTSIEALVSKNLSTYPVIRNLSTLLTELNAPGASNPTASFRLYDLEQQLFKPDSLPANRVLGINLETPQAEADAINQPLLTADIFRVSRPLEENSCNSISYDSSGWPLELPIGCANADTAKGESKYAFTRVLQYSTPQSVPAGTYTVLYDGIGTIHFSGMGCNRRIVNGVLLIDLAATNGCPNPIDSSLSGYNNGDNPRGLEISITQIDATNPVRNIRIVMPGGICKGTPFTRVDNASACGASPFISFTAVLKENRNAIIFNPDYLNFSKDFRVLRMMNLMEASPRRPESQTFNPCPAYPSSPSEAATSEEITTYKTRIAAYNNCILQPLTWAQRSTLDQASWGGSYKTSVLKRQGIPLEVGIALANLLEADPWLNIPHNADDNYIDQYATLLANELDESLVAHIEYSNEIWNSGFWGHQYNNLMGAQDSSIAVMTSFPSRTTEYSRRTRYYAKRATEIFTAFENEFGDYSRLKRVLGGQHKNPSIIGHMLSYETTTQHTDAIAIAPYFHGCWSRSTNANCANTTTVPQTIADSNSLDDIFSVMEGIYNDIPGIADDTRGDADSLDGTIKSLAAQQAQLELVTSREIDLYAYEGGQHLTVKLGDPDYTVAEKESLQDFIEAANRDPRMRELYTRLLTGWKDAGAKLFVLFTAPQTFNRFGTFGIKEHLNSPRATSPKYDGALTFQEALMGCWQGYIEDGC